MPLSFKLCYCYSLVKSINNNHQFQYRFVDNTSHWILPAFYHGHFAYIDFERYFKLFYFVSTLISFVTIIHLFLRYGYKKPHYVQLLRKPLDRLVSYYYFLRYGDDYRPHLVRKKHMDSSTTFDECVERDGPDCQTNLLWLQIPFLCGQSADCWLVSYIYYFHTWVDLGFDIQLDFRFQQS